MRRAEGVVMRQFLYAVIPPLSLFLFLCANSFLPPGLVSNLMCVVHLSQANQPVFSRLFTALSDPCILHFLLSAVHVDVLVRLLHLWIFSALTP